MQSYSALAQTKNVASWMHCLRDEGLDVKAISSEGTRQRWSIQMVHRFCKYRIEIALHQASISFAAPLLKKSAQIERELYEYALQLNMGLDNAHIAVQGNSLYLLHSFRVEDVLESRFYRDLDSFHRSHEYVYGAILSKKEKIKH